MILKLLKQLGEHKLNINYGILRLLQVLKRVKLRLWLANNKSF